MTNLRRNYAILLAGFTLLVTLSAFGQAEGDPWLIVTSGGKRLLNLQTTHEDLVRIFGAANVVEQDGIDGMSGDMEYVTVLFPKDPQRAIEILWRDGEKRTVPQSMTIRGDKSKWKAMQGISLGISLKELEAVNGRPFELSGYGWDYGGGITSWENGSLAADLDGGHGTVSITLCQSLRKDVSQKEWRDVTGSGSFPSSHPTMQKLNPRACHIDWIFPSWEQERSE